MIFSPEMLLIQINQIRIGEFNPEKSDIFSLGITFLRIILLLKEETLFYPSMQGFFFCQKKRDTFVSLFLFLYN